MSDFEQLKRVVEDNFILQSLEMKELRTSVSSHVLKIREAVEALAKDVDENLEKQGLRIDGAVAAIRSLGEGSVDVRREISELRARIEKLEDKAS